MNLRTLFNEIKNILTYMRKMHDFSYRFPDEYRDEYWDKECFNHPTASTCKIYEG
tara:strand:+ start:412 stop:576 length:165 start_codon:yes stop_codon:yes gene_type:complete